MKPEQSLTQLTDELHCGPDANSHCAICADEGIWGEVIALRPFDMALVKVHDGEQEVALDLVENVQIGDQLLVHVGVAIARLDRGESV